MRSGVALIAACGLVVVLVTVGPCGASNQVEGRMVEACEAAVRVEVPDVRFGGSQDPADVAEGDLVVGSARVGSRVFGFRCRMDGEVVASVEAS